MAKRSRRQPGNVELAILRVLWDRGPSSVRQVHQALSGERDTGYTSTLKMMQVMFDKRLLRRNESRRPQLYAAAVAEEQVQKGMLADLVRRAFGGSARTLVMRAIESDIVTPKELAEIRKLLANLDGGKS